MALPAIERTNELLLAATRRNESYDCCWVDANGSQSQRFNITLPLGKDEIGDLRWYLETYIQFPGAGDRARAENIERRITSSILTATAMRGFSASKTTKQKTMRSKAQISARC